VTGGAVENPCPLSSDAFSRFGVTAQENNHEVMEATKMLHNVVIPQFAQWLDQQDEKYIKSVRRLLSAATPTPNRG
jgi:hypothetical protein